MKVIIIVLKIWASMVLFANLNESIGNSIVSLASNDIKEKSKFIGYTLLTIILFIFLMKIVTTLYTDIFN